MKKTIVALAFFSLSSAIFAQGQQLDVQTFCARGANYVKHLVIKARNGVPMQESIAQIQASEVSQDDKNKLVGVVRMAYAQAAQGTPEQFYVNAYIECVNVRSALQATRRTQ